MTSIGALTSLSSLLAQSSAAPAANSAQSSSSSFGSSGFDASIAAQAPAQSENNNVSSLVDLAPPPVPQDNSPQDTTSLSQPAVEAQAQSNVPTGIYTAVASENTSTLRGSSVNVVA